MPVIVDNPVGTLNKTVILWNNRFNSRSIQDPTFGNRIALTDPATWSSWSPSGTNNNVRYTFNNPTFIDSLGLCSHTLASNVASILVQYSHDDSSWTNAHSRYSPLTDEDFILIFQGVSARYWRLNLLGAGYSIGVVFGTKRFVFPHSPVDSYTPLNHSRKYTKLYNDSIKGHFLNNRVMAAGAETEVDMGFFDRDWLDASIRGFERHYNQGGTFFYAGCPSRYPDDMGYCRSAGDDETMSIEYIEGDNLSSLSFGVRSFVGA